jgi:hypothetical protein
MAEAADGVTGDAVQEYTTRLAQRQAYEARLRALEGKGQTEFLDRDDVLEMAALQLWIDNSTPVLERLARDANRVQTEASIARVAGRSGERVERKRAAYERLLEALQAVTQAVHEVQMAQGAVVQDASELPPADDGQRFPVQSGPELLLNLQGRLGSWGVALASGPVTVAEWRGVLDVDTSLAPLTQERLTRFYRQHGRG